LIKKNKKEKMKIIYFILIIIIIIMNSKIIIKKANLKKGLYAKWAHEHWIWMVKKLNIFKR
jgi:hypothetical protein